MFGKLLRVAYGISVAEGWNEPTPDGKLPQGTASYHNHNPGNLRASPYQVGTSPDGFAIFRSDIEGFMGLAHQLTLYAQDKTKFVPPNDTIGDVIAVYAGLDKTSPQFNNYVTIIEKVAGVSRNDTIESILE